MGQTTNHHRLFGSDMLENPYPVYDQLRSEDPVQWDDAVNAWLVTSHEGVQRVLKSREASSDRVSLARGRYAERYAPTFDVLARIMIQADDPVHKNLRNLVHDAFTRTVVQTYEPAILSLCEELLRPGLERGEMEFVSEFAIPLPILVISEIVGVPPEDREQIKEWCDAYSYLILNFYIHISDEKMEECAVKLDEFCAYLRTRILEAGKNPGDDLISSLAIAASKDHKLTIDEVVANCILLLNAGNETTCCLLASGIRLLMENPDQLALLRADPGLIPNAIEEFLRIESPVQFLGRVAGDDMEIGGKMISKGDLILPIIAAANRDPAAFEAPSLLDVTRDHSHQLGFGTGAHLCAGIQLARFEARLAFEYLLSNMASFELLYKKLTYSPNFNLRALTDLQIRVRRA